MLSSLSATDIAFAMIGVMQGVLALVWLLATWLAGDLRRATLHWAAYATLSAVSFAMLTAALHLHAPPRAEMLRALGNLCGVVALIALWPWTNSIRRPRRCCVNICAFPAWA